jgi:predicted CopG family antitoxin
MKKIEIDNDVYKYLEKMCKPFVEHSPNETLRRLLGLDKSNSDQVESSLENPSHKIKSKGGKAPKAEIVKLISAGRLKEGQTLYLHDYQQNRFEHHHATIKGSKLLWEGSLYSMSELARILLQKENFKSNAVRGPAHWYTYDGVSIKRLWQSYLKQ